MPASHPDADLHPAATGPAAALVAAHQDPQPLKLYSGWFCPFVQRSWISLEEHQIPYQYIEINPYHKEASFLALNPRGLVPTLGCPQNDGSSKPLYESNVICEYLDEIATANGKQSKVKLFPADHYAKARMRIWVDYVTSRIIPAFHRFLQHTPEKPYSLAEARSEFLGTLKTWIKEADPQGPYFLGEEFTMADVCLAPWAVRLWVFDHYKQGLGMPEEGQGGEDEEVWKRWRTWAKAVEGRPSVRDTLSEKQYYLSIYQKYADDKAQSEMAKAIRGGRGVP